MKKKFKKLPDKRSNKHRSYSIEDIVMSAFSVFYFQSGSWLNFQRNMHNKTGRSNAKSLFGIEKIPTDNHIRDTLDGIKTKELKQTFNTIYDIALQKSSLDKYRIFDNNICILLDGTYYHHSKKIHCTHCQTKQKKNAEGEKHTEYYHSAITPIIAHPSLNKVLPLFPEMISNEDGNEKQDCELNATKR